MPNFVDFICCKCGKPDRGLIEDLTCKKCKGYKIEKCECCGKSFDWLDGPVICSYCNLQESKKKWQQDHPDLYQKKAANA